MTAATVALCLSSCKKDEPTPSPNPSPDKHLAQILYIDDEEGTSGPYETWNWEGDQLNDITYHWLKYGDSSVAETFSYQDNRIIYSEEFSSISAHTTYFYDGNRLVRMKAELTSPKYQGSYINYTFEYEGDKIRTMIQNIHRVSADSKHPLGQENTLSSTGQQSMSVHQPENANLSKSDPKATSEVTRTYEFTWDVDNLVKVVETCSQPDKSVSYTSITEMTYDNKPNPYFGIYGFRCIFLTRYYAHFSANNMLTYHSVTTNPSSKDVREYSVTRTYTYSDDNYPVEFVEEYVSPNSTSIEKYAYRYVE